MSSISAAEVVLFHPPCHFIPSFRRATVRNLQQQNGFLSGHRRYHHQRPVTIRRWICNPNDVHVLSYPCMVHTIKEINEGVGDNLTPDHSLDTSTTLPLSGPLQIQTVVRGKKKGLLRILARRPVWTYLLIFVNVAVWLLQRLSLCLRQVCPANTYIPSLQFLGAKVSTKILSGQWWRLLTPAVLHVNLRHLFFNSYALFALGSATEILYGSAAFIAIYIAGAIGGNVASVLANVQSSRPSVGSSGAVFALIAAMCVHLDRNRGPIGPVAQEKLRLVVLATLFNLAGGWLMPSVDGWAHFGGVVYGMILAAILAPRVVLHRSEHSGEVTYVEVRRQGTRTAVLAIIMAVLFSLVLSVGVGSAIVRNVIL